MAAAVGVGPSIPQHDGAAAVLALGDGPLERVVLDGVILHLHRQPLDRRIEAGTLGYGPALHDSVELQPQVVVQVAGRVLLDHKSELLSGAGLSTGRLVRAAEISLAPVLRQL